MTAAESTALITADGVYPDVSHVDYLADPVEGGSLSSTGARRLLPPSCPALFAYEREHGRPDKRAFDFGNAAHLQMLGTGPEIVVVDAENWRSAKAQDKRDEARARGAIPLLAAEHKVIEEMGEALRAHPVASKLLSPEYGQPEATLVWTDEPSGVRCRARLDNLPHRRGGRMILPDFKTCISAEKDKFAKDAASYGYAQQAAFYSLGAKALGLADEVAFLFVAMEKTPPYLVNVIQLDVTALKIGAALNRKALDIYAECERTGHWPGYSSDVELVSLPRWYEMQHENELS